MGSLLREYFQLFALALILINFLLWTFPWLAALHSCFGYLMYTVWLAWNAVKMYKRFGSRVFKGCVPPKIDPTGKAVLVTGCGSGFGNAVARRLAARGFHVYAGCRRADQGGAVDLKKVKNITVLQLDVTSDQQVAECISKIEDDLADRPLWGLVNNAGINTWAGLEWGPAGVDTLYRPLLETNTLGMVRVTKACLPLLRRSPPAVGSRVVIVTSTAGRFAFPCLVPYSMTKFAARAFGDGLRREMEPFGVKVSIVEAGMYTTPINDVTKTQDTWKRLFAEMPTMARDQYTAHNVTVQEDLLECLHASLDTQRPEIWEAVDDICAAIQTASEPFPYYRPSSHLGALLHYLLEFAPDELADSILSIKSVAQSGKLLSRIQDRLQLNL